MSGRLLAFFHLCLVSVLFSGPSLTEMKFYRNFFPSSCTGHGHGHLDPINEKETREKFLSKFISVKYDPEKRTETRQS